MELIYATTNENKKEVLQKEFDHLNIKVLSLNDIGFYEEIVEDGSTFLENARIKAHAVKKFCDQNGIFGKYILGDDSGLCIDALAGNPGIYTARYAGKNSTQKEFIDKILTELKNVPYAKRTAYAICDLVLITNKGKEYVSEGKCVGTITEIPEEFNGFLFDPIFKPKGSSVTFSKMEDRKDHRTEAFDQLKEVLLKEL